MTWEIKTLKIPPLKDPILIEGLPGIGNVGKIVMDLLVEKTKAVKIMEFFSYGMPNSVFVTQDNLIDLPKIELYHKKINNTDFLFLTGDVQPVSEEASYEFCDEVIAILQKYKCKYIVTLGGIGLNDIPQKPLVYITGNSKSLIDEFKKLNLETKIYGVVGPIMGISGLLLGIAKKKNIPAVSLLAETFGHPVYLGLKGAREILTRLDSKFKFNLSFKELDEEIKMMDSQMKGVPKKAKPSKFQPKFQQEVNYIG
ncbi:hypothetical protein C4573_02075 [Candidatus Woesearchaeota archaeon]|nr:MAG: hypothetical protein C4573_02075 [Candidatus Woesearchaeota archaeon]